MLGMPFSYDRSFEPELRAYFSLPGATGDPRTLNNYIRLVKGSGLPLSAVTGKWSTVAGTQFGTAFSTDMRLFSYPTVWPYPLTLSVSDGTNVMTCKTGAGGTAETLGAQKLTSIANNALINVYETFTVATLNISSAINSSGNGRCISNQFAAPTVGQLFKYTGTLTLNSGDAPIPALGIDAGGGDFSPGRSFAILTAGANTGYITATSATHIRFGFYNTTNTNYAIPDSSLKIAAAPDATGLLLTDVTVGSFDPNAVAFNITITKP
ncbi:MAG: hypothetical protein LLG06_19790 [Desulfobacteraceae bacterium]|nr:hypothetical protein [Desulfobacteraceae bacterium]